ncbi:MAG: hypothetical protein FD129_2169 [bacterium]|nr:MAG: hypothetical protein FD129_2169 [bacterium]
MPTNVAGIRVTSGLPPDQPLVAGDGIGTLRRLAARGAHEALLSGIESLVPEARLTRHAERGPASR